MTDFQHPTIDELQNKGSIIPEIYRTGEMRLGKHLATELKLRGFSYDIANGLQVKYMVRGTDTTTYAAETVFDSSRSSFKTIRTTTVGNANFGATGPGKSGQDMYIKIDNDTDANRTITFGTPFKVTGTVVGSTAASAVLHFISDGSYFWEVSRTTGLNQ